MTQTFSKWLLWCCSIVLVITFMILQQLPLSIGDASLNSPQKSTITFPYSFKGKANQVYQYNVQINYSLFSSSHLKIVPDDCLEYLSINDAVVPVKSIKGRCNWQKGFSIDLKPYLKEGKNTLHLHVKNKDGIGGLNLIATQDYDSLTYYLISSLMIFSLIVLLFLTLSYSGLSLELILLLLAGILLRLAYLSYTDFDARTFDVVLHSGHLDYIKMIANEFRLPNPTQGWEYHQPPLYYALGAIFYKFADLTGVVNKYTLLQLFSLSTFIIFLFYSIKTLALVIPHRWMLFFATMLLVFWPSGIIHSIRLGNDVLFYALFAISFYYMLLWQRNEKALWITVLFASLALITKANGIILFGIIGILLLIQLIQTRSFRSILRPLTLVIVFFAIAFTINFADNIYYALQGNGEDWLVSNVVNTINHKLFVSNSFDNYVYFDLKTYLKEPYIDAWNDQYGRQYFWNYLFKSSLFSEFFFKTPIQILLASLISLLSLSIFVYIGLAIATLSKAELLEAKPFLLVIFLSLAALLAYRIKIPVACNTDFRYIFPILIAMGYFYSLALHKIQKNGYVILEWFGYLQVTLFSIFTILFFTITTLSNI